MIDEIKLANERERVKALSISMKLLKENWANGRKYMEAWLTLNELSEKIYENNIEPIMAEALAPFRGGIR